MKWFGLGGGKGTFRLFSIWSTPKNGLEHKISISFLGSLKSLGLIGIGGGKAWGRGNEALSGIVGMVDGIGGRGGGTDAVLNPIWDDGLVFPFGTWLLFIKGFKDRFAGRGGSGGGGLEEISGLWKSVPKGCWSNRFVLSIRSSNNENTGFLGSSCFASKIKSLKLINTFFYKKI